jgi:hypothetical protein
VEFNTSCSTGTAPNKHLMQCTLLKGLRCCIKCCCLVLNRHLMHIQAALNTPATNNPTHPPDAVHFVAQAPLDHAAQLLPAKQRALGVGGVCEHQRCHGVPCKLCCLCCCIQSCCVVLLLGIQVYWQRSDLVAHLKACSGSICALSSLCYHLHKTVAR